MKHVLVIGATSAIAAACARRWAEKEARFFLVGRNEDRLAQVAADLSVRGAESFTHPLDVNDIGSHESMLAKAFSTLGHVDVVLIAHGTLPDQAACEVDPALASREFATNGGSVIVLLTGLARRLEEQGSGSIAVITSVAGDRGRPSNYVYGSAKAAVSTFCEGLRARLFRSGVHVMDIRPGFVDTPMTSGLALPSLLVARPETVASRIIAGIERRADVLYAPAYWALIMLVIRSIPGFVFKRLRL